MEVIIIFYLRSFMWTMWPVPNFLYDSVSITTSETVTNLDILHILPFLIILRRLSYFRKTPITNIRKQ
jgi:hypothetical protein